MSLEVVDNRGRLVPYSLFFRIVNDIVPTIVDSGVPIFKRYALAWSWYKYLCIAYKECPKDVPSDTRKWDSHTLEKIAEKLIEYANSLIHDYLSPETKSKIIERVLRKHQESTMML